MADETQTYDPATGAPVWVSDGIKAVAGRWDSTTDPVVTVEEALDAAEGGANVVITREEIENAGHDPAMVDNYLDRIRVIDAAEVTSVVASDMEDRPIWAQSLPEISEEQIEAAQVHPVAGDVSSFKTVAGPVVVVTRVCRTRGAPTADFARLLAGVAGDELHDPDDPPKGSNLVAFWGADPDSSDKTGRTIETAAQFGRFEAGEGRFAEAVGVPIEGIPATLIPRMFTQFDSSGHSIHIVDIGQLTKVNAEVARGASMVFVMLCNEDGEALNKTEIELAGEIWAKAIAPISVRGWGVRQDRARLVGPLVPLDPPSFGGMTHIEAPKDWNWKAADRNGAWDEPDSARRGIRDMYAAMFHHLGRFDPEPLPPKGGLAGRIAGIKRKLRKRQAAVETKIVEPPTEDDD